MLKKSISILLIALMILSMFSACGSKQDANIQQPPKATTGTTPENPSAEETQGTQAPTVAPAPPAETKPVGTADSSLTYLNSVPSIYYVVPNGVSYRGDNKQYGVKSVDGEFDSGAIYYGVDTAAGCFIVQTKQYDDPTNLDNVNCTGVIDAQGKVIVPTQYALIKFLGGHYLKAYKVTGITTDKENYLVRLSSSMFSLTAQEDDTLYTGQWCIYDIRTGTEIPGFTGTTNAFIYQNGDVLSCTENGQTICKNAAGEDIPQDARLFADGSYIPNGENAVYDSNKQKRFDFTSGDYEPKSWEEGYYVMAKYQDGNSYVIVDETGKICSTTFTELPSITKGGLLDTKTGLYDMQGKQIMDKDIYTCYFHNGYWLVRDNEKNVYMIGPDYKVETVCQLDDEGVYLMNGTDFAVTKKVDTATYQYYSITQKAFVAGNTVAKGLVERTTTNDTRELIDVLTDTVLLSGYGRYTISTNEQGECYIYAYYQSNDSGYDVFIRK